MARGARRPRRREGRAVHEPKGSADRPTRHPTACGTIRGQPFGPAGDAAHPATLVRHAPARGGADIRSVQEMLGRERGHDPAIHPRESRTPVRGLRAEPPESLMPEPPRPRRPRPRWSSKPTKDDKAAKTVKAARNDKPAGRSGSVNVGSSSRAPPASPRRPTSSTSSPGCGRSSSRTRSRALARAHANASSCTTPRW